MSEVQQKILVIIPAYNEEGSLRTVLKRIKESYRNCDILVVNDGSTDRTSRIARGEGIPVIDLPANMGIGTAEQTGFQYAARNGYDIVVRVDADGQHEIDDLGKVLEPVVNGNADISVGSRFAEGTDRGGVSSVPRFLGIRYFSLLLKPFLRVGISDPTSGFRAFNRGVFSYFCAHYPMDYPEVDSLILMNRLNMRVREVNVRMHARKSGISSISAFRALYYMVKVTLSLLVNLIRKID